MKKLYKFNIGIITMIIAASYGAYYLLLNGNKWHISIAAIISDSQHLAMNGHAAVLCLLPIYIGLIIFGAVSLGGYLGSLLQNWFYKKHPRHTLSHKKSLREKFATSFVRK